MSKVSVQNFLNSYHFHPKIYFQMLAFLLQTNLIVYNCIIIIVINEKYKFFINIDMFDKMKPILYFLKYNATLFIL